MIIATSSDALDNVQHSGEQFGKAQSAITRKGQPRPVVAIAGQFPSHEIDSGYFQETHPEHVFQQCRHYCELVSQPEQMPRVLEIAGQTALGRAPRCFGGGYPRRFHFLFVWLLLPLHR